jgi:hypothetical protein
MKIREGAYYRTRGGDVIGPMLRYVGRDDIFTAIGHTWCEDGSFIRGNPCKMDLISEVYFSDTSPADTPAPEAKTLRDEFVMRLMDRDMFAVGFIDEAEQLYRVADAMMKARKK